MGRPARVAFGERVYHVLNRANGRQTILTHEADYAAFEQVLAEGVQRVAMRLLAYCVMPGNRGQTGIFAGQFYSTSPSSRKKSAALNTRNGRPMIS